MMMRAKKNKNRGAKLGASRRDQKFMVEGSRLVREALQAGLEPEAIFFCRDVDLTSCLAGHCPPEVVETFKDRIYKTPYQTMQLWSELKTSPGILGTSAYFANRPKLPLNYRFLNSHKSPLTLDLMET
jgi:tRNA G18 (ribose-2'-O)-methylase SpoU